MGSYDTDANPILTTAEANSKAAQIRTAIGLGTAAVENVTAFVAAVTPTDLAAGTVLTVGNIYFDSFTASRTLTFSGTPADGDSISLTFDCNAEITLTIPTSYRLGDTGTTTSITFPTGNHVVKWIRLDSRWYVADSAWVESGADVTAPTLSSATIASNGTTLTTVFSEACSTGAGGTGGLNIDASTTGANIAATYASGSGTNTWTWTLASTIQSGETCDIDYTQPGDGIEDASGNDLASITSAAVTNNSTQGADVTAPTLSSATIAANGTTLTLVFDETVAVGAGGNGGFNVDASTGGTNVTATYASGSGSNTLVYTLGTTILSGETCDLDYTQPGNGIEDTAGNDLASITSAAVTNNSTQTAISYLINEDFEGTVTGWTEDEATGTVNLEYATSPLAGSQSAFLDNVSGNVRAYQDITSTAILSMKAKVEIRVFPGSNQTNRKLLAFKSGTTFLGSVTITTADSGSTFAIGAMSVTTAGTASTDKFAKGAIVYIWMDFNATTDVTTVYWNSTDSKPTGDANKKSEVTGVAFSSATRAEMVCDVVGAEYLVDDFQVWEP